MHQLQSAIAPQPDLQLTITPKRSEDELHQGSLYYLVESGSTFIAMVSPYNGLFWVTDRNGQTVKCSDLGTAIALCYAQAPKLLEAAGLEAQVEAPTEAVDIDLYTLGFRAALLRGEYGNHPDFRKGFQDAAQQRTNLPDRTGPEPLAVRGWGDALLNCDF